jgi:hypothetical protein
MPPVRTARGTSGIPRPVVTPAYPRRLDGGVGAGADTPVGRIQPVFDGFELAESSVWGDSLDLIDPQAAYDALPASASASAATPPPPPSLGRSSQYSAAQSARRARRQTVVHTPMAWSPPSPPPQPEVQLPAVPQSVRRARRQTVVHTPMAPSPPSSPQPEVQPEVQEVVPQSIRRARRQTTLHTPLPPPLPASSLPSRPSMPGALFPATPFTPDPAPSALMRSTRARDSNVRGRTPARRRDMLPSPPAEDLPEDVPEVVSALRRSSVARTPARRREMSPPSRIIEEVSMVSFDLFEPN